MKALVIGTRTHKSQKSGFAGSTRANQEERWEGGVGCGSVNKEMEKDGNTEDEEGCNGNYEWRRAHEEGDKAVGVSPGHDDDWIMATWVDLGRKTSSTYDMRFCQGLE